MRMKCLLLLLLPPAIVFSQPTTTRIPVVDAYFGLKVTDHYRWMENMKDSSVMKWFEAQDAYTEKTFSTISGREQLVAEYNSIDSLWSDLALGIRKDGEDYFYLKRFKNEQKTCLIKRRGEAGKEEVVIDFKKAFPGIDITFFPIEYSPVSKYFAFHIFEGKHEATSIYFYDLVNKKFFPEQVRYSYGGNPYKTKFTSDGKGFFYFSLKVENNKASTKDSEARLHQIGTDPTTDKILASKKSHPALFATFNDNADYEVTASPDHKYLLLTVGGNAFDHIYIAAYNDLNKEKMDWVLLSKPEYKLEQPIIRNGVAYFLSKAVPNHKIVKCILSDLKVLSIEDFIPEEAHKVDRIAGTNDYILFRYTNGINSWFQQYHVPTAKLERAMIDKQGIISTARMSEQGNEILLTISSWNLPATTYLYNPQIKKLHPFSIVRPIVYPGAEDLLVKEVEAPGHDGTMIPLSIIYHKNTKLDGTAICHLNGYGAYGATQLPTFSAERLMYAKRGVVFAIAHVRGGGVKGDAWRLAGFKSTKANTWKDFISCAEWLIGNKYTSAKHLIAESASAGGIMVGRAMTERPDLFTVIINRVGMNNVMRHEIHSAGNIHEFGTVKDSAESRYLYEMDVLHHIKEGAAYPAVLVTVGMADGRLSPWQPGKFAAALQNASTSGKPVLLQVNFEGAHFGESGKTKYTNLASEWAFALWQAGHPDFKPKNVLSNRRLFTTLPLTGAL